MGRVNNRGRKITYKCHVKGCTFEGTLSGLLAHVLFEHRQVSLSEYIIEMLNLKGELPIKKCRQCGAELKVNLNEEEFIEAVKNRTVCEKFKTKIRFDKLTAKFRSGFCSPSCSAKFNNRIVWNNRTQEEKDAAVEHLINFSRSPEGRELSRKCAKIAQASNVGRIRSLESRNKARESVKKAIADGRLKPPNVRLRWNAANKM
jgi:hypothetical protein